MRRTFNQPTAAPAASAKVAQKTDWGRNLLLFSPFELFLSNLTGSYEHILPSRKIGIRVPLSIGLIGEEEYGGNFRRNKTFSTGLGLQFYPFGQGRLTYYVGSAAHIGFFRENYPYDPSLPSERRTGNVVEGKVITGGLYQFTKAFFGSADVGLGVRRISRPGGSTYNPTYNYSNVFVPINLHIGLRF